MDPLPLTIGLFGVLGLLVLGARLGRIARARRWRVDAVTLPPLPDALRAPAGSYPRPVVGEAHHRDALRRVVDLRDPATRDLTAALVCEDRNLRDDQAVRVEIGGRIVGRLSREDARRYRRRLEELGVSTGARRCEARVSGGHDARSPVVVRIGLTFTRARTG